MKKDTYNIKKMSVENKFAHYNPKTINQQRYVGYLNNDDNKIIIAHGPAGTGKTLFACLKSIEQLKSHEIDKIVITRPLVTVEEELGFLPGNILKKMDPWTKPIFDIFLEYYTPVELDSLLQSNVIEVCPLAFMRGRTFKNSFIIADEMQNSSPKQMKMLTTRIGIHSKMIITGDLNQSDFDVKNGLSDIIEKLGVFTTNNFNSTAHKLIKITKFDSADILRSEIAACIIDVYNFSPSKIKKITKINFDELYKRSAD
jgi:phosphate starvation-inducible PhoH-like protein